MKVTTLKLTGKVNVEAFLGQFGHTLQLGHLRILEQILQKIAGKLAKGVTIKYILDCICDSTDRIKGL